MTKDIFECKRLKDGCPVLIFDIPRQIQKELDVWVKESKKTKNDPLSALKAHNNVGYLHFGVGEAYNSYQCSIPPRLIEDSYWLPWVLRISTKYWGQDENHRLFKLRSWSGHFDGYDIWTNFSYKGDQNPRHNHSGFLSGVIYYKNHGHPTIFNDYGVSYEGKDGTMVLFPSPTAHSVDIQTANKERITLAFNIMQLPMKTPDEGF